MRPGRVELPAAGEGPIHSGSRRVVAPPLLTDVTSGCAFRQPIAVQRVCGFAGCRRRWRSAGRQVAAPPLRRSRRRRTRTLTAHARTKTGGTWARSSKSAASGWRRRNTANCSSGRGSSGATRSSVGSAPGALQPTVRDRCPGECPGDCPGDDFPYVPGGRRRQALREQPDSGVPAALRSRYGLQLGEST